MRIALVAISKNRVSRDIDYHILTAKAFVEERSNGRFRADILELAMTDDLATGTAMLVNGDYDVILFHLVHWNIDHFRRTVAQLGEPRALIGVWGHDSFAHPDDYLKGPVRFVIQDEPELPLFEIASLVAEGSSPAQASDIILRDDAQKSYLYSARRVLDPLDLIPSPYLAGLIEVDENTSVYWETSRGCLFRCDFCVEFSHLSNVRYHSFGYLEKELALFRDRGVRHIVIGAPLFNLSHQHFTKILAMLNEYLPGARIEMQVRPDILTREEIDILAQMNVLLHFGIPTFKTKVLEQMATSINVEKALQNIRYINNYPDLPFTIDIMAGLPKTSYQDFLDDLEQTFYLWPVRIDVYRLSLYPGTRSYNRIREFELRIDHEYPWHIVESPQFSKRDIEKIDEIAEGVEMLYDRGRMVSVFTMMADSLGLKCAEVIERWNKHLRKGEFDITEDTDFDTLFARMTAFFSQLYEKQQKKKIWPLAEDLLSHNRLYTMSLMTVEDDRLTFPYQLDSMNDASIVGMNRSAFVKRFTYNIEDVIDAGYIDLRRFAAEEDKENLYGLIYRLEGGAFTRSVTDEEGRLFLWLAEHGETTLGKLRKKFPDYDVMDMVAHWCSEGALYLLS
ncbi:MAG TPA: radical SAM protein [bacterium]|nr:radical SAM protein [bacterium]